MSAKFGLLQRAFESEVGGRVVGRVAFDGDERLDLPFVQALRQFFEAGLPIAARQRVDIADGRIEFRVDPDDERLDIGRKLGPARTSARPLCAFRSLKTASAELKSGPRNAGLEPQRQGALRSRKRCAPSLRGCLEDMIRARARQRGDGLDQNKAAACPWCLA